MQRHDFIKLIIDKKEIDNDVINVSKEIDDFPYAYSISEAILGNNYIKLILNAKELSEIDSAREKFKNMNIFSKGKSHLKQQGVLFINELVAEKKLKLEYSSIANSQEKERNNRPRGKVLGIDLGTTNSLASIIENGQASAIPLKSGERMIPSVISITKDNKFDVGENAKRQQIINPEETFFSIKRFIGRRSTEIDSNLIEKYPFNIDIDNEKIGVYSKKLDRRFECEELSAQILLEIKSNCIDADNMQSERMSEIAGMKVIVGVEDEAFMQCLKWSVKNLLTIQQLQKLKSYSELLVDSEIAINNSKESEGK